jgi:type II secretory pathway pseudopilin PulG
MEGLRGLRRPASEGGYSLVEVVAAVAVFALVFAAVSIGVARALDMARGNRNRSVAAYLATQALEEARSRPFDQVVPGRTTCSWQTPGPGCAVPQPYTVTQDVSWVAPSATSSSCNVPNGSSGASLAYKRVTVTLTWPDMNGVAPVTSQTLLAPPAGVYDPNDGHVAVKLFDRAAGPLAGHTVTLSGPSSDTQVSTADGCVFFAYLAPGTYTVTLATPGHVDRQGNQPATQTAAVVAGQITTLQFDYDQAATLQVTLAPPAGAVPADGVAVTVANSNLTVGTKVFAGSGPVRALTPLFPYASGYEVWAGACADADPAAHLGGSRDPALASDPGATTAGTAAMDAVDVTVRRSDGTPVAGAAVQAVHDPGTGCPSGETLASPTPTDANGRLRLALPYGTWRIEVTSPQPAASTPVLLDPVAPSIPPLTVVLP